MVVAAVLFTRSCNKWHLLPSSIVDTIIDSVYAEQKMVVAAIAFTPSKVSYTETLTYDGWQIPWIGSRGFKLDPEGKVFVGLGYDLAEGHKLAKVLKAEKNDNAVRLFIEVQEPVAITMDCRADIRWSWSIWTGQPSQDFAYNLIEQELFTKANEHAMQNPDVSLFAQTMCAEWYTTALIGAGFTSVQIVFVAPRHNSADNGELFPDPFVFEWQRDSTVIITDEEATKILEQAPGNIAKKVWEYFE